MFLIQIVLETEKEHALVSDLLDHLRVLLHDVQEAIVCRHRSGTLLRGARQLLEQVGHYVVQTGAAARAHHRI